MVATQLTHQELLETALAAVERTRSSMLAENFKDITAPMEFGNGSTATLEPIPGAEDYLGTPQTRVVIHLSEYDQLRERAAVFKSAIANMMTTQKNIGQAILAALWSVYVEGLIQYDGEYNPDEFMRWVNESFASIDDMHYVRQLVFIVLNVLQPVYAQEQMEDPYIIRETGEVVTVDLLINRWGLVTRLRELQKVFTTASREEQEKLLAVALNGKSRGEVEAAVDEVAGFVTIKLPYREIYKDTGTTDLFLPDLTRDQVMLFRALVGTAGEALL